MQQIAQTAQPPVGDERGVLRGEQNLVENKAAVHESHNGHGKPCNYHAEKPFAEFGQMIPKRHLLAGSVFLLFELLVK